MASQACRCPADRRVAATRRSLAPRRHPAVRPRYSCSAPAAAVASGDDDAHAAAPLEAQLTRKCAAEVEQGEGLRLRGSGSPKAAARAAEGERSRGATPGQLGASTALANVAQEWNLALPPGMNTSAKPEKSLRESTPEATFEMSWGRSCRDNDEHKI